ncbi:spore coat protein I [Clostridium homopropionicum DSM 5847]|uniref:Spore coat protein I n=1 Tax=Clostridium homopropionicum DSM 5847 TaxID=1121318 RepID=A0A0L6ZDP1_9CLOT|nr:CotS family spore coat protein [Clostridium homopropionicum]KOA20908.1 spore coat protein I [Clostridium homopropionicum DSM 5847]SFG02428.1 spore coat protein, CotS family [Clostridium homopropionicum]
MKDGRLLKNDTELSEKEARIINKILKNFDISALNIEKVRSVYKIKTASGNLCLKRLKHGKNKAENGNELVNLLERNGFNQVPKYYKTKENNLFIKYKGLYFYLTEWIDGKECNLDEIKEVEACARLLANFHKATSNVEANKFNIRNNIKSWPEVYKKKVYDIKNYEKIIANKKIPTSFDIYFKENINFFLNRAMLSLKILNTSEYYKITSNSKGNTLCHDSFYYQNVIKKDDEYYIIDLDSIVIDLQIKDLGKFIRRLMSKKSYKWDFSKALKIIEAYSTIKKLDKPQLEVMLAIIIFPHTFWKLGRKRYIKCKHWSEQKFNHKLKKIIANMELEEKFTEDFLAYLDKI